MLKRFPRVGFKENRIILSIEELKMRVKEAIQNNKSCEIGLYSFTTWYNGKPVPGTAIIDVVMLKGKKEILEQIAEEYHKKKVRSTLVFDGKDYVLFLELFLGSIEELEKFKLPYKVKIVKDEMAKFILPGTLNLKTGKLCKVIKRWKS